MGFCALTPFPALEVAPLLTSLNLHFCVRSALVVASSTVYFDTTVLGTLYVSKPAFLSQKLDLTHCSHGEIAFSEVHLTLEVSDSPSELNFFFSAWALRSASLRSNSVTCINFTFWRKSHLRKTLAMTIASHRVRYLRLIISSFPCFSRCPWGTRMTVSLHLEGQPHFCTAQNAS